MDRSKQIDTFNRFTQVSRETITSLIKYERILIEYSKNINLIGNSTINQIWTRHFLDSFQVIDFIDKNDKSLVDLGSGAGFPGLVLAIAAKDREIPLEVRLIEKSIKKTKFLEEIISKLNLNAKVLNENVLDKDVELVEHVIVSRAFKPLQEVLKLMHKKAKNFRKFFIFLGKTGETELLRASKIWDIKYKQRVSVTSSDSSIIEINELKKIN